VSPATAVQTRTIEAPTLSEAEAMALAKAVEAQLAQLPSTVEIADPETCRRVKESLPVIKRAEDAWAALFKPIKDFYYRKWKEQCADEERRLKPLATVRASWAGAVYRFEQAEAQRRRDEELRLAQERRREEEDRLLREAAELEESGQHALAEAVVEHAVAAPPPVVTLPPPPKVSGVSSRANWQFKFAGCAAAIPWDRLPQEDRDRVLRLLPREYLRPDEVAIGRVVKAMKGATRIPGIEAYDAGTVAVSGR
jgi:hypothetical protein